MNKILALILTVAISGFTQDFRQMGSNYYAYPTPTAKYTKAPAGYKPFYLSHYGRHGKKDQTNFCLHKTL